MGLAIDQKSVAYQIELFDDRVKTVDYFFKTRPTGGKRYVTFKNVKSELEKYGFFYPDDDIRSIVEEVNSMQKASLKPLEGIKRVRTLTDRQRKDVEDYIRALHVDNEFRLYSTSALTDRRHVRSETGHLEWGYKDIDDLIQAAITSVEADTAVFASVNGFKGYRRSEFNLNNLNALFVDIDAHGTVPFNEKAIVNALKDLYERKVLPYHSFYVLTGRGMQVYWLIDSAPAAIRPLWSSIENRLIKLIEDEINLEGHKVDERVRDVVRILRVPEALNLKTRTYAKLKDKTHMKKRYRLTDLLTTYFPNRMFNVFHQNPFKAETTTPSQIMKKVDNVADFIEAVETKTEILRSRRIHDLNLLIEGRDGDIREGIRHEFLSIYGWMVIHYLMSELEFERELQCVNKQFKNSLRVTEVRTLAKSIYDRYKKRALREKDKTYFDDATKTERVALSYILNRYCYRNETIIKRLEIKPEERIGFQTILTKPEREKVYAERRNAKKQQDRRDENGVTSRERAKIENRRRIQEAKAQGLTQVKAAEKLNISLSTVKRYWN